MLGKDNEEMSNILENGDVVLKRRTALLQIGME